MSTYKIKMSMYKLAVLLLAVYSLVAEMSAPEDSCMLSIPSPAPGMSDNYDLSKLASMGNISNWRWFHIRD